MKWNSSKIWFSTLLLITVSINASAGISVTPLQQEITVRPGSTAEFFITVTNTNRSEQDTTQTVLVELLDFTVSPIGKMDFGKDIEPSRSATNWITVEKQKITLEPGQAEQIKATINVPANADGDYFSAFMVSLQQSQTSADGIRLMLRTASGIFIHVQRRNYIERANIESIDAQLNISDPNSPAHLEVTACLENTGLIKIMANMNALIYSGSRQIASLPMSSNRRRIFPGHKRIFKGQMSKPLPAGDYQLRFIADSDNPTARKVMDSIDLTITQNQSQQWSGLYKGQGNLDILLQPQNIELNLNPGRFTVSNFNLSNKSFDTVIVKAAIVPEDDSASWLKLPNPEITLAPQMQRSLALQIKIPADTPAGEYNTKIILTTQLPGSDETHTFELPVNLNIERTGS